MGQFFKKIINLGVHDELEKGEEKLVKLLNFICLIWYGVTLLFIITDYFFEENYLQLLTGYLFQVLLFILVQFLQSRRKYVAARMIFVSVSHLLVFIFCNTIVPGKLIEMFYILTPLFALMFFKKKWIHYFYLIVAILSFAIPKYFWDLYSDSLFSDPTTIPVFFISIFLLVNYFRNLNLKNEKRLKKQKEVALKDKVLIENQKKELEDIHNFQNQFFINIAHEIRTPLTILKGSINKLDSSNPEIVETLKKQSNKIKRIVDDVMDLTKMDSKDFKLNNENIELNSFVVTIFNSFNSNFQHKSINYQLFDTTTNSIIVSADKIYLESAICNILTNAIKYTDKNQDISLIIEQLNNKVFIKIKDTGIGIVKDDLDKVFNRFYQSDNSINRSGGSGIGLAFSKEIISKLNGKLTVESELGQGSTFSITLPIASSSDKNEPSIQPETDASIFAIEQSEIKDNSTKTILLVEDNKDMRDYIVTLLEEYTVIEAENGLEGIEKIENNKIDYIITDYMMPKMNGKEFVKSIQEKGNDLPILMLTAKSNAKMEMLRLGIDDYIMKPFEEEELLLRIAHGLKNHSRQQKFLSEEKSLTKAEIQDKQSIIFINDMRKYIIDNCTKENFGVIDLCDEFAVSQSTLYRKIKSITGLNIKEFITEVKLQKAKEIVEQNELLSLKQIGYRVGFLNYTHFGKLFEERFGKKLS